MQHKIKTVTPNANILEQARASPKKILETKYVSIISQSTKDIGRTNLLDLDTPTEGAQIASKPYSVPLKCREFVDQEIKQFKEAGIISRSMSNGTSPLLVVPKREERVTPIVPKSFTNNMQNIKKNSEALC